MFFKSLWHGEQFVGHHGDVRDDAVARVLPSLDGSSSGVNRAGVPDNHGSGRTRDRDLFAVVPIDLFLGELVPVCARRNVERFRECGVF